MEELGARTLLEINILYKAKQYFVFLYKMNLKLKAIARKNIVYLTKIGHLILVGIYKEIHYHLKVEQTQMLLLSIE